MFEEYISELEVEHNLEMLLPKLQEMINEYYGRSSSGQIVLSKDFLSESRPPVIIKKKGRVYWKLILEYQNDYDGASRSVYGFIRRSDGAILKAASWQKPETRTKGAIRGYVTDEFAQDYFNASGVIYDV
jgi:hypothetical protein